MGTRRCPERRMDPAAGAPAWVTEGWAMNVTMRLAGLCMAAVAVLAPGWAGSALAVASPVPPHGGNTRVTASAASWPNFHYNDANTGYNPRETVLGPGNAASLHELWLAGTGTAGAAPDVSIASGNAYLGSGASLRAWSTSAGKARWT